MGASDSLATPFGDEAYVALLWAADATFSEVARMKVVHALVDSGCRYIVCGGTNCERWHDEADLASVSLSTQSDSSRSEMPVVMTSWHDGESIEEVVSFAANCTNSDNHDFKNFLVLIVGEGSARLTCAEQVSRASQTTFDVQ